MKEILVKRKLEFEQQHILASEVEVIDRLLERYGELQDFASELEKRLSAPQQLHLLDGLLGASWVSSPSKAKEARQQVSTLKSLNDDIAELAQHLCKKLNERYELSNTLGAHAYDDFSPVDWINRAASKNFHYRSFVQEDLLHLKTMYDGKYWPQTWEVVQSIADYANEAEVEVNDAWTRTATKSRKSSKKDTLSVFLKVVEERKEPFGPPGYILPADFQLPDRLWADFCNVALDLPLDELVDAGYVKRTRQALRAESKE